MHDGPAAHHRSALQHVRTAISTVGRLRSQNRRIADSFPAHRSSAAERAAEAEQEIIELESEQGRLEALVAEDDLTGDDRPTPGLWVGQ